MSAKTADITLGVPHRFIVCDAASAHWVIRKIVEARKYAERVETWAAAEVRRAQREEAFLLRRFGAELEAWARQEIQAQHDGRKSVCLPAGTDGFRIEQARLRVTEEAALAAGESWALAAAAAFREDGRSLCGGWPGTMSEARVRVAAFLATLGEKRSRDVASLEHMAKVCKADTGPSTGIDFAALRKAA